MASTFRPQPNAFWLGVLMLASHGILLWLFVSDPWSQAAWVLPFFCAGGFLLGQQRWKQVAWPEDFTSDTLGPWLLWSGGLVLGLGTLFWSPWFGWLALLLSLAGFSRWIGGRGLFHCLIPGLVLGCLFLRPPVVMCVPVFGAWDSFRTHLASAFLDWLGVLNVGSGTLIEVPGRQESALAGYSSVRAQILLVGFALFWGMKKDRPWWYLAGLVMVSLFLLLMNDILFLALSIYSDARWGINLLAGMSRWLVRLFTLFLAGALVVSIDHLFSFARGLMGNPASGQVSDQPILLVDLPDGNHSSLPAESTFGRRKWVVLDRMATLWSRPISWWGWGLGFWYLFIGLIQLIWMHPFSQLRTELPPSLGTNLLIQLPDQIAGWRMTATPELDTPGGSGNAITNRTWTYQNGQLKARITFSYPFSDFLPVLDVPIGAGWQVHTYRTFLSTQEAQKPPHLEVQMTRPPTQSAVLLCSYFTPQAQWLRPIAFTWVRSQLLMPGQPTTAFRLQVFASNYLLMGPAEVESARRLFESLQYSFMASVANRQGGKP